MDKIDFKKEWKHLYQASARQAVLVEVPAQNYLMIDGQGDPNTSPAFSEAIEVLYKVAYAVKFRVKKGPLALDYAVMPLEALWWADDMAAFSAGDKSRWQWTLMILQPGFVTPELLDQAMADVARKKHPPAMLKLRLQSLTEGRCAQIMHLGPFAQEGATIERLHRFIAEHGQRSGRHHEIYLGDMRKTAPSKWKTILRQPLR